MHIKLIKFISFIALNSFFFVISIKKNKLSGVKHGHQREYSDALLRESWKIYFIIIFVTLLLLM